MPEDPKDPSRRSTPARGAPVRPITERGRASGDRDRQAPKIPPEHIRAALGYDQDSRVQFVTEELTPVTMIYAVRSELKSDIDEVRRELDGVKTDGKETNTSVNRIEKAVAKMSGEVETTNKLLPQVIDTLRAELSARRADDHVVVTTKMDITKHREVTEINDASAGKRAKWKAGLKLTGLLTSASFMTMLITLLAGKC